MNYDLNTAAEGRPRVTTLETLRSLWSYLQDGKKNFVRALPFIAANSLLNLTGSLLIGYGIDRYIRPGGRPYGILPVILLFVYMAALVTSHLQNKLTGIAGQKILYQLRYAVFGKLQSMPLAFFHANRTGDLIARVNNDTESLNQFFAGFLTTFIACLSAVCGACFFMLLIDFRLGAAALVPAVAVLAYTRVVSPRIKRKNAAWLAASGRLSAAILENLDHFKVFVAFRRQDYFRGRMKLAIRENRAAVTAATAANNSLMAVYGFFSAIAQLIVLCLGLWLAGKGDFSPGLLISYLAYCAYLYNALRIVSAFWGNFQQAVAAWQRIGHLLFFQPSASVDVQPAASADADAAVVQLCNVGFGYVKGKDVVKDVSLAFLAGRTYALVGPTGGGKTTIASLIAGLYEPTTGVVRLGGQDLRVCKEEERVKRIGYILQEPVLFTATLKENIFYGDLGCREITASRAEEMLEQAGMLHLLCLFEGGLEMSVEAGSNALSMGQKQLIAFMRAVLRDPDVLILDEASANIDPATERLLDEILHKMRGTVTRIVIAHRLDTIRNSDEIFFVNNGQVLRMNSFQDTLYRLHHERRVS